MTEPVPWIDPDKLEFPSIHSALTYPDGLLAAGGDLSTDRLALAYRSGIFPWYEEGHPILWWSPDPRAVVIPDQFSSSRSLQKTLRQNRFEVRRDTVFSDVVNRCGGARKNSSGTWITNDMKLAYQALHQRGLAHSIECFLDNKLVGGLYGVALGKLFFGESMFHLETDASKVAFAFLCRLLEGEGCPLVDCQLPNEHLASLGAITIPRTEFARYLDLYADHPQPINWDILPTQLPPWSMISR